ncbi:hypothetical protein ACFL5Z_18025 [Planctomycetota bacterium]
MDPVVGGAAGVADQAPAHRKHVPAGAGVERIELGGELCDSVPHVTDL